MKDLISREEALELFPLILSGELFSVGTIREQLRKLPTVEAVPLSVIEKIKAEITAQKDDCATTSYYTRLGFETALAIIDKAVKECTHEPT